MAINVLKTLIQMLVANDDLVFCPCVCRGLLPGQAQVMNHKTKRDLS